MAEAARSETGRGSAKPPAKTANGRERLLLVSMSLFADRGFDGVTIRDIANEAEVSIGLVNHHFGSKKGLQQAVDDFFLERTSKAIQRRAVALADRDIERIAADQREWIVRAEDEWPSFAAYLRRAILEGSDWGRNLLEQYFSHIEKLLERPDVKSRVDQRVDGTWMKLIFLFILLGPLVLDPHIKSMMGKSAYDPDMWAKFQEQFSLIFWKGVDARE